MQSVGINELLRPRTGIVSPGGRNELRPYNFASCLMQKNLKPFIYETSDDGTLCDILIAAWERQS